MPQFAKFEDTYSCISIVHPTMPMQHIVHPFEREHIYGITILCFDALIFHINIPCDKTFLWVPIFLKLWPWPWSLTHYFFKTLPLLITFEKWVLELWYFTWMFPGIKPFCGYPYFWHCDLDLELWYFTWVFLVIRPFWGFIF